MLERHGDFLGEDGELKESGDACSMEFPVKWEATSHGCSFWEGERPAANSILLPSCQKETRKTAYQQTSTVVCARDEKRLSESKSR